MLRKLFFVALITLNFAFTFPAYGQVAPNLTIAKEFNPLCWQRKACEEKRTELNRGVKPSGTGFVDTSEAGICLSKVGTTPDDADWGRCLPSNVVVTEIAFGGKKEFSDIGAFLTNGYKLALGVASILAAIMIVVAGFQWAASGGNAGIITGAKNRIAGAIIGLFIAYTSYFILYTINPDLVNLHLPQAWLLRPQAEIPNFCSAIPVPTDPTAEMFHEVFTNTNQTSTVPTEKAIDYEMTYADVINGSTLSDSSTTRGGTGGTNCGYRYLSKDSGSFACYGDGCPTGQACANMHFVNVDDTSYSCETATIIGSVTANYAFGNTCLNNILGNAEYNPEIGGGLVVSICQGTNGVYLNYNPITPPNSSLVKKTITDQKQIYKIIGFTQGYCASNASNSGTTAGEKVGCCAMNLNNAIACQSGVEEYICEIPDPTSGEEGVFYAGQDCETVDVCKGESITPNQSGGNSSPPIGYAVLMDIGRNCGISPLSDLHIVGKNGIDLNKAYKSSQVTAADLFSEAELTNGGIINNIDVSKFSAGAITLPSIPK